MIRIFLVEDNYSVREELVKEFEKLGCFIVGEVSDTSDKSFQKAISSNADLFILDIELEHPTAGFEFAKRLHQHDSSVRFAYLTKEQHLYESAHESKGYPRPFEFLDKRDFTSKGMDTLLKRLLSKFRSEQALFVRIAAQKINIKDIVLIEKLTQKSVLDVYLKDGTTLEMVANLKHITDPTTKDYIATLTQAHGKSLLVNENYIVKVERDKGKDNHAILHLELENGKIINRQTAKKEGIKFFRRHS